MPQGAHDGRSSPGTRSLPRVVFLVCASALLLASVLSYLTLDSSLAAAIPLLSSSTSSCPAFPADLNITYHRKDTPLAPHPLPPPHQSYDASHIIPLVLSLSRSSTWSSIANISLEGDTFEPEGLVRLGPDRIVLSAAEYTSPTHPYPGGVTMNGTDRSPGAGIAHLLVYDARNGTLIADASITHPDSLEYHNGGIDYDGRFIWGVVSQRRPNSSATVYVADPHTLGPARVFHHPSDHLGTLAINPVKNSLTALNWGARQASTFYSSPPSPSDDQDCASRDPHSTVLNPSHYTDYQDCKFLGHHESTGEVMLCSGVTALGGGKDSYDLGGIALVSTASMLPLFELPITLRSAQGVRMTQNPFDVSVEDGRLRFYWAPDQRNSTLYVYEVLP